MLAERPVIALLGWGGAVLVLASYAQRDAVRLRQLSVAAGCLLIAYNVAISAWPTLTMELILVAINACRLSQARAQE